MTKKHAHEHIPNAGSPAGPHQNAELDRKARLNAMLLPPVNGMLEADRHAYPMPPQRLHEGMNPTGSLGGGHLHDYKKPKTKPLTTKSASKLGA